MKAIEFEIQYLKGEIKSMHKMGLLVPSSTYERLHKLEKKLARDKHDEEISKSETKSDLSTDEGWWRDYELYEMQND